MYDGDPRKTTDKKTRQFMKSYSLKILESHLDTFKHVNNATYLTLFEQARWDWITSEGLGLEEVQRSQIGPVLLEIHLIFKKEVLLREQVVIETRFLEMKNSLVMLLEQKLLKADGSLAARLEASVGIMDMAKRKLIVPPEAWMKAMEAVKA